LNHLFVLLALQHITFITQRLKVSLVKEVIADRSRDDMVHALRSLDDSLPLALLAQRMRVPPALGQLDPSRRVVSWIGQLPMITAVMFVHSVLRIPG
jgi:hypothetical protein